MRRALTLLAAATALLVAPLARLAHADGPPSVWDRVEDPGAGARYHLHVQVQERMFAAGVPHNPMHNAQLESARALLEEGGAATSSDVRLRFDLGSVYYHLDRFSEALAVLQPALAMAPHDPAAASAWEDLAYAAAKLDRSTLELEGYDRYLALSIERRESHHLSILGNRAEAEMRLGNLDAAVAGYRDVIEQGEHIYGIDPGILVLAHWGLAVALDRDHDWAEAEHEAYLAAEKDPDERIIGDQEEVFFVPEYERDWYYALGRTQHARHTADPTRALMCWDLVVETWSDYIARATKATAKDRWVDLARMHLAVARADQRAAATRLGRPHHGADARVGSLRRHEHPC